MKRKASRAAPYERPAKLNKRSTTTTVSRNLSTLRRSATSVREPMAPPRWPSIRSKAPPLPRPPSVALPVPKWPALIPTGKAGKEGPSSSASAEDVTEVSEEPSVQAVPGLRRMSTLPLAEEEEGGSEGPPVRKGSKSLSKPGSKSLSKTGSSLVATLEKKGSVVTLDTSGSVTTVTRLASGSSVGETTSLSAAPPSIRKELSKAASTASSKGAPAKKVSSIRVTGVDAREEVAASLRRSSSKASRSGGSLRKEASVVTNSPSTSASAVPLPPGGLIEIVFSFDTTGSMSSCINEVRGRVGDMIQRLQADIPGIRISVIAHGDYCDVSTYVIKWIDFGASLPELSDFVQTIGPTGGGDADECYELVLARAQTELSWTPGSQRSLVMIGDANPHPPSYYATRDEKLDWKEEAQKLADMGVRIYAVQALNRGESTNFYKTLARVSKGLHLKLDQFNNIFDIIMAVCYNEKGVEFVQAYEEEVRHREGGLSLHKDLEGVFSAFRGGKAAGLTALPSLSKGMGKVPAKAVVKVPAKAVGKVPARGAGKRKPPAAAKGKAKTTTATRKVKTGAPPKAGKVQTATAKRKLKTGATAKGKKGQATAARGRAKTTRVKAKEGARKARGKGVKAVKGRKPSRTTGRKTARTSKAKKSKKPVPGVKRKFREAVKDGELNEGSCLRKIKWTPWHKAIIPLKPSPKGREAGRFKHRTPSGTRRPASAAPGRLGLRNIHLLDDRQNSPAVYEIAVKLKPTKRYVVFFKACSSWRKNVLWDTVLLNARRVHEEVNAVVGSGGQIWLRRGNVKDQGVLVEVKKHVSKHYDYAWQCRTGRGNTGHRRVRKCSVLISGNS